MATRQSDPDAVVDLNERRLKGETDDLKRQRRDQELDDIAWLMSEREGRRLMWRLLSMAGIHRSSFTGNSHTFFNEGRRIIGTTLLADIAEAGLEELEFKMKVEHRNDRRKLTTQEIK